MRSSVALASLVLLANACQIYVGPAKPHHPAPEPPKATQEPASDEDVVVEVFQTRKKPGATAMMRAASQWLAAPSDGASGELKIQFLDVGQGDTTLITCPDGHVILVDVGGSESLTAAVPPAEMKVGGGDETAKADAARKAIEDELDGKPLHALFVTHPDRDHYNGLGSVLTAKADQIYLGGKLSEYKASPAKEWLTQNAKAIQPSLERNLPKVQCGTAKLSAFVASPSAIDSLPKAVRRNAGSIVLVISQGEADFVLTGDIVAQAKQDILTQLGKDAPQILESEVLKLAHHGADNGLLEDWFGKVKPSIAIVSSRAEHRYGHPRQKVVDAVFSHLESAKKHSLWFHDGKKCKEQDDIDDDLVIECDESNWHRKDVEKAIYGTADAGPIVMTTKGETITVAYSKKKPKKTEEPKPKNKSERDPCMRRCPNLACGTKVLSDRFGDRYAVSCFAFESEEYKKCIGKNLPGREIWEQCTK
ncbi:MAG: MBL fold metallo-hydrolase [Myxococcales bacterium]|nr:MBL fold metallo-hydrolase [Myxococcales bacterium]